MALFVYNLFDSKPDFLINHTLYDHIHSFYGIDAVCKIKY